jgi:trehalose 6-phosphate phosphatase
MISPKLPAPRQTALFLDVDGTLLELAPRPEAVVVDEATRSLLAGLARRLDGALALVSGRPLTSLDALFAPLQLPAAGVHGLQRRDGAGVCRSGQAQPGWHAAVAPALQRFAATHAGLQLEDKGDALALHYRNAPALAEAAGTLAAQLIERVSLPTRLLRGKQVLEFMPQGHDKGLAIEQFMLEPAYRGRIPVFIGDDVTDEAGFAVVNAMHGCSIRVGRVGDGATTVARHSLKDVAAVHERLWRWLEE